MPVFDWRILVVCLVSGLLACGDEAPAPGSEEKSAAAEGTETGAETDAPKAAEAAADTGEPAPAEEAAAQPVVEEPPSPLPPSLAPGALREELRKASQQIPGDRKQLEEERRQLEEERSRLEALATDLAKARNALREETAKLEEMLQHEPPKRQTQQRAVQAPLQQQAAPAAPEGDRLDTLAKSIRGMRSEQAAALLTRLPRPLAAGLLLRLRPNEAGPILDKLTPDVAAELVGQVLALPSREET